MVSMHKSKLDVYGFYAQKQTHQLLEIILLYHKSEHIFLCWLIVVKAPYLQTDYRIVVRRLVDTPLSYPKQVLVTSHLADCRGIILHETNKNWFRVQSLKKLF
jgi:hypothetical protein